MMVLDRGRDDLGRRGAARIDQDDDRKAAGGVARLGEVALDVALPAAALRHDLAAL